jgi:hypothetical protein
MVFWLAYHMPCGYEAAGSYSADCYLAKCSQSLEFFAHDKEVLVIK